MMNAAVSYRIRVQGAELEAFLRGTNLLDEEARNHVSIIKDIAPLGGRAVLVGVRGSF
jgi:iron complex outermembrane receptor protein